MVLQEHPQGGGIKNMRIDHYDVIKPTPILFVSQAHLKMGSPSFTCHLDILTHTLVDALELFTFVGMRCSTSIPTFHSLELRR